MRNCYVYRCDWKHKDNPKRAMFMLPKDPEKFEQWKKVLPKHRPLTHHDRVCEKHFQPTDILRDWSHIIQGQTTKVQRCKPNLRPEAVPCLFALSESELKVIAQKGRRKESGGHLEWKQKKQKMLTVTSVTKQPKRKENGQKISAKARVAKQLEREQKKQEIPSKNRVAKQREEQEQEEPAKIPAAEQVEWVELTQVIPTENNVAKHLRWKDKKQEIPTEQRIAEQPPSPCKIEATEKSAIFEELYENIFEVELPSTLWGVHRDPERQYIAFTRFQLLEPHDKPTSISLLIKCSLKCRAWCDSKLAFDVDLYAKMASGKNGDDQLSRFHVIGSLIDSLEQPAGDE